MEISSSSSNADKFIEGLPKSHFLDSLEIRRWEGFWLGRPSVTGAVALQASFEARDDDVFLASSLKTGTTWLKALSLCIMRRQQTLDLLTLQNPNSLVPTVENAAYVHSEAHNVVQDASAARLLHTHLPHALLPDSVRSSPCKIVYVARSPNDTVISSWHFFNSRLTRSCEEPFPLQKFVDCFCSGMYPYGPFVEHVAGYWEESRKRPQKILFLKYEELKADPRSQVLKIAEFLGRPFGDDEGEEVNEILRRCSFGRLKNLEVNKSGFRSVNIPNSSFFRKGEVGDSKNYLTPEMEMQINQTICLKLEAIGLYF